MQYNAALFVATRSIRERAGPKCSAPRGEVVPLVEDPCRPVHTRFHEIHQPESKGTYTDCTIIASAKGELGYTTQANAEARSNEMSFHGLAGNLLIGTGAIHSAVGLMIPELQAPLVRILLERTTQVVDINDTYQRECSFWFQFGGLTMGLMGGLLRQYCLETQKPPPEWFGWSLISVAGFGVVVMPLSGFWLVLGQGIYMIWSNKKKNVDKKTP